MNKRLRSFGSLTLALTLLGPATSLACSPIKVFYVSFDRNSAKVPSDQVQKLTGWMAELRERYPRHEAIFIESSVDPTEHDHDPRGLGLERGRNVAHVLREDLHFNAKITLPKRSYVVGPGSSAQGAEEGRRVIGVQLDFLPACPHECPCQMGDPLYKPSPQR